jgi:hypothetical protein
MREKAIKRIIQEENLPEASKDSRPTLSFGDYFHDGQNVLADVTSWHASLHIAMRKADTITSQVLDLVDKHMLLGEPKDRMTSKDICTELRNIISQNQVQREKVPENVMAALLEVDEEAPSKAVDSAALREALGQGQSLIIPQDRKARKSKLLGLPLMKTAHRSKILKSELSEISVRPSMERPASRNSGSESSPTRELFNPVSIAPDAPNTSIHQLPTNQSTTSATARHTSSRKHKRTVSQRTLSQNVFQAREDIEKREKHNYLKRTRKDELLTKHFGGGNRDIVSPIWKTF